MNEKTLRILAMKSMSAMLIMVLFSAVFSCYNDVVIYANTGSRAVAKEISVEQNAGRKFENIYTDLGTGIPVNDIHEVHLVINKPEEGGTLQISLEDLFMQRQIKVSISGLEDKTITKQNVICEGSGGAPLLDVSVSYEYNPNTFLYTAVLNIQLDDVYEYRLYEDSQSYYIGLRDLHEAYDKIIVVDAGHGGNDVGAYTKDMVHFEKNINLSIQKYLKEMLDKEDIRVYYTRLEDEKVYLNPRLDLANAVDADMFISIHCNSSEYASPKGSEVLYSTKIKEDAVISSDRLATVLLDELVQAVELDNRGIVNGDDIYIIGNSQVPVALVEVGFISNKEDLNFLQEEENQKKIAEGIYNGIMRAYEEIEAAE